MVSKPVPTSLPQTAYANVGGKINQSKINMVFSHCDVACIVDAGTVTHEIIKPNFSDFVQQGRAAILYSGILKEIMKVASDDLDIEACALSFKNDNTTVCVVSVYRSPSMNNKQIPDWLEALNILLKRYLTVTNSVIVASDMNWRSTAISPSVHKVDCSEAANNAALMFFELGLQSIEDFSTMIYDRTGRGEKSLH